MNPTDQKLEQLKQKYASVFHMIEQQGIRLSHVHIQDNKLFIQGSAPSEDAKNKVWDQIKLVDPSYSDLTADIQTSATQEAGSSGQANQNAQNVRSYTVQPGDSLSKISKEFYGDASKYMKIFQANQDQLSDPDKIRAGQILQIPA